MDVRSKKGKDQNGTNLSISKVIVNRIFSNDHGTFGKVRIEVNGLYNFYSCFSLELPDRGNKSNISCIPMGSYKCIWSYSPRFKKYTYEILEVPKRTGIRIHSANLAGDKEKGFKAQLNGCIALGEKIGTIDKQQAILVSKPAIRKFETILNYKPFILEIK